MARKTKPSRAVDVERREAIRAVREIYADLESRPVERVCRARTECCRFRLTGRTPQLTRGEAILAATAWRATGRKILHEFDSDTDGSCPFLAADGRCSIYRDRPFGCRTHFCQAAGGVIERGLVIDLIRRLEVIDEALHGDGPRSLPSALAAAW